MSWVWIVIAAIGLAYTIGLVIVCIKAPWLPWHD